MRAIWYIKSRKLMESTSYQWRLAQKWLKTKHVTRESLESEGDMPSYACKTFTDKSATTTKYKFMPITSQNKHSFTNQDQLASKQHWRVLHAKAGNMSATSWAINATVSHMQLYLRLDSMQQALIKPCKKPTAAYLHCSRWLWGGWAGFHLPSWSSLTY